MIPVGVLQRQHLPIIGRLKGTDAGYSLFSPDRKSFCQFGNTTSVVRPPHSHYVVVDRQSPALADHAFRHRPRYAWLPLECHEQEIMLPTLRTHHDFTAECHDLTDVREYLDM